MQNHFMIALLCFLISSVSGPIDTHLFAADLGVSCGISPGKQQDQYHDQYAPNRLILKLNRNLLPTHSAQSHLYAEDIPELHRLNLEYDAVDFQRVIRQDFTLDDHAQNFDLDLLYLVQYESPVDVEKLALLYSELPEIEEAEPDHILQACFTPNDYFYSRQWAHHNTGQANAYGGGYVGTPDCDIDSDQAWNLSTGSSNVIIAVIDSGIDLDHPEFTGRIVSGYDFVNNDYSANDDEGHGTACAGLAAAKGNNGIGVAGVDWNCRIMPVKVLNSDGWAYTSDTIDGVNWARSHGADVISMSLGGFSYSSSFNNAVNSAFSAGILVVCSAGNDSTTAAHYPSGFQNAMSIGALSPCNTRKTYYSCDGEYWWGSNYGNSLDLLAPGTRLHTTSHTGSYFGTMNGTSGATPLVAGVAALIKGVNPSLSPTEIRTIINNSADDLGSSGWDTQTGHGRLNAHKALQEALAGTDTTPPETTITAGCAETITVPHRTFSFTGSDDTDPTGSLVYSYHLDSEPWSTFSGSTQASFNGMGNGQHIFRVRARDLSGNVDASPAICFFTVDTGGGQGYGPAECIVTGPGPGPNNPCQVCIYDPVNPADLLRHWRAYGVDKFGVNVATGDIDGDEYDEIVTGAGPGAVFGPHVRAFDHTSAAISGVNFLAYGTSKWGVNVACGDIDGDSIDEIITGAGPGAVFGPHVRGWNVDGGTATSINRVSYFAYGTPKWGVNVACGDIDGDGFDEIITGAGPGAVYGPHVRAWNYDGVAVTPIPGVSYYAYGTLKYGVNVTTGDVDGDGFDEIITGAGPGEVFSAHVRGWNYDGSALSAISPISFLAYTDNYRYGVRVGTGDLDNDNRDEILTVPGPKSNQFSHVRAWNYDGNSTATMIDSIDFLAYDETVKYGGTVAAGDFDGNHTDGMTRR